MGGIHITTVSDRTPEDRLRTEEARSPIEFVPTEVLQELQGRLVALLADGPDKGTVVASVPLDEGDPSIHRRALNTLIHASNYPDRNLQIRQILKDEPGSEEVA